MYGHCMGELAGKEGRMGRWNKLRGKQAKLVTPVKIAKMKQADISQTSEPNEKAE